MPRIPWGTAFYGCLHYGSDATNIGVSTQTVGIKKPRRLRQGSFIRFTFKFTAITSGLSKTSRQAVLEVKQDKCFSCYCMGLIDVLQAQIRNNAYTSPALHSKTAPAEQGAIS